MAWYEPRSTGESRLAYELDPDLTAYSDEDEDADYFDDEDFDFYYEED